MALARCELAAEFPGDLRRIDAQMRDTKRKLAVVVRASGTTLTGIFGVGPVIAATMIGYVADASRFPSRDRFAAAERAYQVLVSHLAAQKTARHPQYRLTISSVVQMTRLTSSGGNARNGVNSSMKVTG